MRAGSQSPLCSVWPSTRIKTRRYLAKAAKQFSQVNKNNFSRRRCYSSRTVVRPSPEIVRRTWCNIMFSRCHSNVKQNFSSEMTEQVMVSFRISYGDIQTSLSSAGPNWKNPVSSLCRQLTSQNTFARLKQVFKECKITKPEQVFNIDESGFLTSNESRYSVKSVFDENGRSNSVELNWTANSQHVTMMPVVSADGRAWIPLALLPGKQAKYRKRHDGTRETPSNFLPPTAFCVYREKPGVDTDIFCYWGEKFVEETSLLRKRHRNIRLALDGYRAHCSYKVLQLFKDNNIVVVRLPAHTSHRTQPLDFSVFSPYKTAFRNELNKCTIFVKDETKNDVYTICELLTNAYNQAVNVQNITSGFQACALWDNQTGGINADVIKATEITNLEGAESHSAAIKTYHDLVQSFSASVNSLRSDGDVLVNETLNTTTGLLLTEERVLTELREREEERKQAEKEKKERPSQAEANRLARKRKLAEKQRRRVQAEVEEQAHLAWLALRGERARIIEANRSVRRSTASLRARSGGAVTSDFH